MRFASCTYHSSQTVQLFLTTPIDPLGLDYHILSVQSLLSHGLRAPELRDELYCQVLRQTSGHTLPTSPPVLQGWYLLFLILPIFHPVRRLFRWYLQRFIERHLASPHTILADYARQCQACLEQAEKVGGRECRPSRFELLSLMSRCVHMPTAMHARLKVSVCLTDGSLQVSRCLVYVYVHVCIMCMCVCACVHAFTCPISVCAW